MCGEHGLAFWIEAGAEQVLFDTGQTPEVLLRNADRLGIDLTAADAVVLSHGHYDHTGGLGEILRSTDGVRVFIHPGALARRFSRRRDGTVQEVGIPPEINEDFLRAHTASLNFSCGATLVTKGCWATGEVPRLNAYEDTGGDFFFDAACNRPDPIPDDQALFFDTRDGLVVVLGCGHAGVVNTLRYVQLLSSGRPIHAVMGGMHLINASEGRVAQTVETLREFDLGLLAPAHCTGARAQSRLWWEFQDTWEPCQVGSRFEFPT
jgi:7,8-dihydropterin-6-yl-methyl-4-(beta-D-ribofuranosyl)aminobenzene 5'-phosphate synthase